LQPSPARWHSHLSAWKDVLEMYWLLVEAWTRAEPRGAPFADFPTEEEICALIRFFEPLNIIQLKAAAKDASLFAEFPLCVELDAHLLSATDTVRAMGLPVNDSMCAAQAAMHAKLHLKNAHNSVRICTQPAYDDADPGSVEK
jgi:hypothetical protein